MKKHKILKTLAIIGALFGATHKAKAAGAEANQLDINTVAEATVFANGEKASGKKAFGDITVQPRFWFEKGDNKLGYEGSFYKSKEMDARASDWMTFVSKINFETENWAGFIGRDCTRFKTAGYLNCPSTTAFSNDARLNGTSRMMTGANLTYKPWGLELGYMANDGRMSFDHWDTVMLGYKKQFNDTWGVQFQAGGGAKPLTFGGLTVAYTPNKDNAVVGEVIYKNHKTTGVLTAKHNLTDKLALFAGVEVGKKSHGKIGGMAEAGIHYKIGKGFGLVGAIQQDIGGKHDTRAVIGLQYSGNFTTR
jgi:hypothetical protein